MPAMTTRIPIPAEEPRSAEELARHYEVERRLAARLRGAPRDERLALYPAVYDELFRSVPTHPQIMRRDAGEPADDGVAAQLRLLRPLLRPGTVYLEVGPGDCRTALAVAPLVARVYAVDISSEIVPAAALPDNMAVILSNGLDIPVPADSVDLAYSHQLVEHLHPDDAREQLDNILRALKPGGRYVCVTPNRVTGPHDISRYFDPVATGFHLHEYTAAELEAQFLAAGFRRVEAIALLRGRALYPVPVALPKLYEAALAAVPRLAGRSEHGPLARLSEIRLVATK